MAIFINTPNPSPREPCAVETPTLLAFAFALSSRCPVGGGTVRVINAELKIRAAEGLEAVLEPKATGGAGWTAPSGR